MSLVFTSCILCFDMLFCSGKMPLRFILALKLWWNRDCSLNLATQKNKIISKYS